MSPERRRETIVQAALPLVAELGAAVTTAKIARAAGIGEATIFRVFDDKNAVLRACIVAAMDPAPVLEELRSIPLEQPIEARLAEAVYALEAHLSRMGAVVGAMSVASGGLFRPRPPGGYRDDHGPARPRRESGDQVPDGGDQAPARPRSVGDGPGERQDHAAAFDRAASTAATRQAILELIEPDRDRLRLPAEAVAAAFTGLFMGRGRLPGAGEPEVTVEQLVDLFLHGAMVFAEDHD